MSPVIPDVNSDKALNEYSSLPLEQLAAAAQENYQLYLHRQPTQNAYALELFRRAFQASNLAERQLAWERIHDLYLRQVQSWVRRHRRFENSGEEVDFFANGAFGKFYARFAKDPQAFMFDCLEKVLAYLYMCVHSTLEDYAGPLKFEEELTEELWDGKTQEKIRRKCIKKNIHRDGQQSYLSNSDEALFRQKEFWEAIQQILSNGQEQIAVLAYFQERLDDKEIARKYSSLFKNARQVANMRGNALERLRRHKSDLHWLFG